MRIRRLACFAHLDWDPGPKALREFSLAMLIGFGLIGLLVAWRHGGFGVASYVLFAIGAALAAGGSIPRLGRWFYLGVYLPSGVIGFIISQVILTLMFLLVFLPIALMLRAAGKDLLRLRPPRGQSLWVPRTPVEGTDRYYRQF